MGATPSTRAATTPRDLAARLLDALDLEPELVQRGDDLVDRRVDGREVADPGQRRAHQ